MEPWFSFAGVLGAALCVGMYAAVSFGRASAEKPFFFLVNGAGALLVMTAALHEFDFGDAGAIFQEVTWAVVSVVGAARALRRTGPRRRRSVNRRFALFAAHTRRLMRRIAAEPAPSLFAR